MYSPIRSEETRTQDSLHASSQHAVGAVLEETRRARGIAEAAIAKAKSVHGEIESKVSSLVAQAAASTAHITDALSKRVGKLAAETEAKTLHTIGTIAQQLEQEIIVAALSTVAMAEVTTCMVVEGTPRRK